MQVRQRSGDNRLYAPSRDVAHLFKPAMRQVASWIEDGTWPVLAEFLTKNAVDIESLGIACAKMCQCIGAGADRQYRKETCVESLTRSGFLEEPIEAQLAVLASLGAVFVGAAHNGLREATLGDEGPLRTIDELLEHSVSLLAKFGDRKTSDA